MSDKGDPMTEYPPPNRVTPTGPDHVTGVQPLRTYKPGDVVYVEGSSAILGDVVEVVDEDDQQFVKVAWRATVTEEDADDLTLEKRGASE